MRRLTVEECRSLNARDLGQTEEMREALGDAHEGLFSVRVEGGEPLLLHKLAHGEHPWKFECPICGRLVVGIYLPILPNRWGCRECHDLEYSIRQKHERRTPAGAFAADVRPERKRHRRKT